MCWDRIVELESATPSKTERPQRQASESLPTPHAPIAPAVTAPDDRLEPVAA